MLLENINQFKKIKSLFEQDFGPSQVYSVVRKDPDFRNISNVELASAVDKVYEGFGEKILNTASKAFGGDISKIDTVLTQMKEQELKFNKEENEIYVEFYNLLEKQKDLQKQKDNPEYKNMMKEITQAMNSLNSRMDELTKSHDKIFNALEENVKSLTGKNNRKKKYFNAKRATDVLETQSDRYEKIKSLTKKSTERANSLEKFFGVRQEEIEKDVNDAEKKAKEAVSSITPSASDSANLTQDPEKGFFAKFELIKNSSQTDSKKRWAMKELLKKLDSLIDSNDFDTFENTRQSAIVQFFMEVEKEIEKVEKKIYKA
jgi:hypothetical protein